MNKPFPQDKEYELSLIKADDNLASLKDYIGEYIEKAAKTVNDRGPEKIDPKALKKCLLDKLSIIVDRYLKNGGDKKDYKFCTYFSWYLKEEINKTEE